MAPPTLPRRIRQRPGVLLALLAALLGGCASGGNQRESEGAAAPVDAAEAKRLGEEAYAAGDWRGAEPHYLALAREIPQDAALWFRLGNIYARTDRPDAAIAAYREALVREADNGKAWFNMGVIQLRQAANSFRRLGVHVEAEDPMAIQGAEAYQAIMTILGVDPNDAAAGSTAAMRPTAPPIDTSAAGEAAAPTGEPERARRRGVGAMDRIVADDPGQDAASTEQRTDAPAP